jgi:hypothetical protein
MAVRFVVVLMLPRRMRIVILVRGMQDLYPGIFLTVLLAR